uniref:Uncharacterized protein n=1 Tax=Anguilla anguilla TaxID=7936 RepID=A0A0E9RBM0_ANGAN
MISRNQGDSSINSMNSIHSETHPQLSSCNLPIRAMFVKVTWQLCRINVQQ